MNLWGTLTPIEVPLGQLASDAPLTTSTDAEMYHASSTSFRGKYHSHVAFVAGAIFGPDDLLYRIGLGNVNPKEIDIITFDSPAPEKGVVAHELSHRYFDGYAKEARGYTKLVKLLSEHPELKEKLNPIAEGLKKKIRRDIKDVPYDVAKELEALNEALGYAVGKNYGDGPPEGGYFLGPTREEILERMKPCEGLIDLLGIDGARAFVRNRAREMYLSGKVISLEKEVEEFKEGILTFFNLSNQIQ